MFLLQGNCDANVKWFLQLRFIFQLGEAHTSQEEMSRLRMEQKRLSQECAENQQLISVLEMQRDILAKSVRSALH